MDSKQPNLTLVSILDASFRRHFPAMGDDSPQAAIVRRWWGRADRFAHKANSQKELPELTDEEFEVLTESPQGQENFRFIARFLDAATR